jgi:hypothetical protein
MLVVLTRRRTGLDDRPDGQGRQFFDAERPRGVSVSRREAGEACRGGETPLDPRVSLSLTKEKQDVDQFDGYR